MHKFKLNTDYNPIPDQIKAIKTLSNALQQGIDKQVLLGVTGSGKTFTVANVINKLQLPTLVISHNKTLAAQLYQEFRDFFPKNAVSFFVSYYDYYQPEAYIPSTDTYIEKDAGINEMIDKLRLAATTNLITRKDVIVVASVSCIYNIGSPREYGKFVLEMATGMKVDRKQIIDRLIDLQYERGDFGFHRGSFRVRGNIIDIYPAYRDEGIRIELTTNRIRKIQEINSTTGELVSKNLKSYILYPAKHFMTDPEDKVEVFNQIQKDLEKRVKFFKNNDKHLEAQRLSQKVKYDIEMIKELGYVKGIENYSRYFDGRKPGDPPYVLLDYFRESFGDEWMVIVDESHITFPQIRGMYAGDLSRKKTLIDYGFRLPAALDNRPLKFEEFLRRVPNFIATSATPSSWEIDMAKDSAARVKSARTNSKTNKGVVEQLIRPTGIPDPKVEIRPVEKQVSDVIDEIKSNAKKKRRSLVTTLTKKTAEDLSKYLEEQGIKVHYLHSDIKTLERTNILEKLRKGEYDCIVGVNLLREGLDLPEVALVAILDADKEGFLRSRVSLIQTMGRAARHKKGYVILYADEITGSMKEALKEVKRRRKIQLAYNKKHNIKPKTIKKPIRERLIEFEEIEEKAWQKGFGEVGFSTLPEIDKESLTPMERKKLTGKLRREMKIAARTLNFELAAEIRDTIKELEK